MEQYVSDLHKQDQAAGEGVYAVPTGAHVKDNEQVMSPFLGLSLVVVHLGFSMFNSSYHFVSCWSLLSSILPPVLYILRVSVLGILFTHHCGA